MTLLTLLTLMTRLAAAGLLAAAAGAGAAPPAAPATAAPGATAEVRAAHELLASMQAEKMMRMTAGMSRYANEKHRRTVLAKLDKVPPQEIYRRLALPVSSLVTLETATEMRRFYTSSFGRRVLHHSYNSKGGLAFGGPQPTAAERAELKRPAYILADKAFKKAEPVIHHQFFILLMKIANQ